jgi:hypothetical protein
MKNLLLILALFVVGCSEYGSYDECMTKEIAENDGKQNHYISRYCSDFAENRKPKKKNKKKDYKYYGIDNYDAEVEWERQNKRRYLFLKIRNKGDEIIKAYRYFNSSKDENGQCIGVKNSYKYSSLKTIGGIAPGQTGKYKVFHNKENPCWAVWAMIEK